MFCDIVRKCLCMKSSRSANEASKVTISLRQISSALDGMDEDDLERLIEASQSSRPSRTPSFSSFSASIYTRSSMALSTITPPSGGK